MYSYGYKYNNSKSLSGLVGFNPLDLNPLFWGDANGNTYINGGGALDGDNVNTWNDRSSFVNNATQGIITKQPTWNNGNEITFDGGDCLNIDTVVGDIASTTNFTFATWYKPDLRIPGTGKAIITFNDTDAQTTVDFYQVLTGKLGCQVIVGGTVEWQVTTNAIPFDDGVYCHVAVVYDGTDAVLHVNGEVANQSFPILNDITRTFSNIPTIDNGRIGCLNWNSGGDAFGVNGSMFDTFIFNYALSTSDIANLKNYTG